MKPSLRVLLVEDAEIDAQLILRQLIEAGFSVDAKRVEREQEFRDALNEALPWDLLLCDYQMPQFDAPKALAILKESQLDIPFLVVSGSISTELAIEMMRQGAHDYLFKGDMARFVPAVQRELRELERRREHKLTEEARLKAETAGKISEQRYRELYQTTNDLILSIQIAEDGGKYFEHWNATCERLLKISLERDAGKRMEDLLPPEIYTHCATLIDKCLKTCKTEDCDATFHKGEEVVHFHSTIHPIRDFSGRVSRLIVVARDITERKRSEESLKHAREELELRVKERTAELTAANTRLRELDRLKSEFLATMSHELRTPLNSIIGFTSLVKEEITGPLNEEQKKQLGMVYAASKHLLGLINDLLDVSRIEAGRFKLDRESFDFAGVVSETMAQMQHLAQSKKLALRSQLPPHGLPMVGDRRRCLQVLLNLTHNAIKFTEEGSVDIVISADDAFLHAEVIDTGIGVRAEHMGQLFEAFRQIDGSARRSYEGTGLGLYLCRKLLILMGGEINAHSVLGQGTRLSFKVPRQLPPDTHSPRPTSHHESHNRPC
jgi:PAS domain S-box-containing protein